MTLSLRGSPCRRRLFILLVAASASCTLFPRETHLERATRLSEEGDIEGAVTEYRSHIEERQRAANRPDWDNPNFYLLSIGDLRLKQDRVDDAIAMYAEAEKSGVEKELIADRYRLAAKWYEDHQRKREAMALLQLHRDLDPLLFDAVLDRLARELTEEEQGK